MSDNGIVKLGPVYKVIAFCKDQNDRECQLIFNNVANMTIDTVCETTGVHLDGNFSAGHYEICMPDDDCMSYQIKELKPELETESIFGEGLTMETISW